MDEVEHVFSFPVVLLTVPIRARLTDTSYAFIYPLNLKAPQLAESISRRH